MTARKTALILAAVLLAAVVLALPQTSPAVKADPGSQTWYMTDSVSGVSGANYRMILGSGNGSSPGGDNLNITAGTSKIWVAAYNSSVDEASNVVCHMSGTWSVTIKARGWHGWWVWQDWHWVRNTTLIVDIGVLSGGTFTSKGNSGIITVNGGWDNGWDTYTFSVTTSNHTVNPGEYLALKVTATGTSDILLDLHNSHGNNGHCHVTSPSTADDYPGTVNINISFTVIDYGSTGINFGSLDAGAVNQPEVDQNSTYGAVALKIGADTNVNVNIQLKGTNFTSGGNTILIGNVKYNNTNSTSGAHTLTDSYVPWYSVNAHTNDTHQCYYWISIPGGQAAGSYNSTFTYQAVQQ